MHEKNSSLGESKFMSYKEERKHNVESWKNGGNNSRCSINLVEGINYVENEVPFL